ncbi:MAG: hypothetical protein HKK67_07240 [Chlorobiaceae bacterium]|nr:hypothetical protein [Chlorobiaceae bacterium]
MSKADEHCMMEVKCHLTEEENIDKGRELADHVQIIESLQEEKRALAAAAKTKIDSHNLEAITLSLALRNGYEYRTLECRMVKNYTQRTVDIVRLDTGELVQTRPMEMGEAQESLFDETASDEERHKGKITLLGK